MKPLVLVREAGTLVWETACGSGSTAVGAWRARRAGRDLETEVRQPGGTLRVRTAGEKIYLTGRVTIGETAWVSLTAAKKHKRLGRTRRETGRPHPDRAGDGARNRLR